MDIGVSEGRGGGEEEVGAQDEPLVGVLSVWDWRSTTVRGPFVFKRRSVSLAAAGGFKRWGRTFVCVLLCVCNLDRN